MDSVRLGRVLGTGARLAAQTAVRAVDAATAPNPAATQPRNEPGGGQTASRQRPAQAAPTRRTAQTATGSATNLRQTSHGIARGTRRFGEAVWSPVVRLSGVLWLELTGVFFGLFALFAAVAAWKLRGNLLPNAANPEAHLHLEIALGMTILFGYFCLSSFLRASRRGRRR